jgi:hypothetical protein
MPTTSVMADSWEDVAPLRLFLPSFLKTVTDEEWKQFEYAFYIGFDEEDKFFDNEDSRALILDAMNEMVRKHSDEVLGRTNDQSKELVKVAFNLIRFPYSKGWVTYLWNGLFVHAIKDNCDYFYQVIIPGL